MPDTPILGLMGAPPHARLYLGKVVPEAPGADVLAVDDAGLPFLRQGRLYSVEQSAAGFLAGPRDTGIPDHSRLGGDSKLRRYDMEAWRNVPLPSGGALLVWVEPVVPALQEPGPEQPRELLRVGWRTSIKPNIRIQTMSLSLRAWTLIYGGQEARWSGSM